MNKKSTLHFNILILNFYYLFQINKKIIILYIITEIYCI